MSDLVVGEAVSLDLRLARLPSRTLALLLDVVVQIVALVALTLVAGHLLSAADDALAAAVQLLLIVAVLVGYPVLAETLWQGRTLGKAALGLRVVRDDGGSIRFRQALVRGLLAFFVDIWLTLGVGAIVSSTLSARGKRVGDVLAGTIVVRERTPAGSGPAPLMPAPLQAWAEGADLSGVDDALALAARQILGRRSQLAPQSYADLCLRIAGAVAGRVSPPPPDGTPPEAYLRAVVAERRRRVERRGGQTGKDQPPAYPAAPVSPPAVPPHSLPGPPDPAAEVPQGGGFTVPG